jgi:hypothetical protein
VLPGHAPGGVLANFFQGCTAFSYEGMTAMLLGGRGLWDDRSMVNVLEMQEKAAEHKSWEKLAMRHQELGALRAGLQRGGSGPKVDPKGSPLVEEVVP